MVRIPRRQTMLAMTSEADQQLIDLALETPARHADLTIEEIATAAAAATLLPAPVSPEVIARIARAIHDR